MTQLRHFVMNVQTITPSNASSFSLDTPTSSEISGSSNLYPWAGEVNSIRLRVFQGGTQISGQDAAHLNLMTSGSVSSKDEQIINVNGELKMTGSLSSSMSGSSGTHKWGTLMVAPSTFVG